MLKLFFVPGCRDCYQSVAEAMGAVWSNDPRKGFVIMPRDVHAHESTHDRLKPATPKQRRASHGNRTAN